MSRQMLNEQTFGAAAQPTPIDLGAQRTSGVMTVNGVVNRAAFLLTLAVVSAAWGWTREEISATEGTILMVGLIGLIVLSIVTAAKPKLAVFTGPVYAVVMGVWAGIISKAYDAAYPGIVLQAVFATFAVFLACLVLYATRIVKVTNRMVFVVFVATAGIGLMYLAAIVLGLFGVNLTFIDSPSPLGILLSVGICIVAALNLFLDFRFIEEGAKAQAPTFMAWYSAFGLLATLIWLYLEILRLLGKIRQ
ncbi:MAG TPA: Bax inhibitor-1/YccA family protein [Actinomycetota bacterium]